MSPKQLLNQTVDRIKELEVSVQKSIALKDKNMTHILKDTLRNNYLLYKALTGSIYPHQEEVMQ